MISLRCEDCQGTMDVDESKEIITCPYCGSKKILPISDDVRIEKIREESKLKSEQMEHEYKAEKEKRDKRHELIFAILFILVMLYLTLK